MKCAETQSLADNPCLLYWKYESETKAKFRSGRGAQDTRDVHLLQWNYSFWIGRLCVSCANDFHIPCRLSDLIPRFGRSVPELSFILLEVTGHVFQNNGHLLPTVALASVL